MNRTFFGAVCLGLAMSASTYAGDAPAATGDGDAPPVEKRERLEWLEKHPEARERWFANHHEGRWEWFETHPEKREDFFKDHAEAREEWRKWHDHDRGHEREHGRK